MSQSPHPPFYPQIWELDKWSELGFKNKDEAQYWQNSSCGILCLKMGLEKLLGKSTDSVAQIISKGQMMDAYSHQVGWSHQGLVNLAKLYGIEAMVEEKIEISKLKNFLDQNALVIASIKWAFNPAKSLKEKILFWKKGGGHLALVIGYDRVGFYVHHTSITKGFNWENKLIPFEKFVASFTGRGIILQPKER